MTEGKKIVVYPLWGLLVLSIAACGSVAPVAAPEGALGQDRLTKAEEMFRERCKFAGEKIYRTADEIEGIFLLKVRPERVNFGDQYLMSDPYGDEFGGDAYIMSFLRGHYESETSGFSIAATPQTSKAYRYVEAIDPKDGKRYRYTGSVREVDVKLSALSGGNTVRNKRFVLNKIPASGMPPRYGVSYDDISTVEERNYWIAGGSLKVIDLATNEVIAERIGYMMDRGQGDKTAGRSPWLLASNYACPTFQINSSRPTGHGSTARLRQAERFVEKVLKPVLEN